MSYDPQAAQQLAARINANPVIQRWLNTPMSPNMPLRNVLLSQGIQLPSGYDATLANGQITVTPTRGIGPGLAAGALLLGGGTLASLAIPGAAGVGASSAAGAPAVAGTAAGAGAGTAGAAGAITGGGFSLGKALLPTAINAAAGIYGAYKQSSSANAAAKLSADAANRAADMEAQTAAQQLAFEREQAAQSQSNYVDTRNFNRQVYTDQQARLAPYRAFGQGALMQLGQPIPRG